MIKYLFTLITIVLGLSACNVKTMNTHKYTNHLIHESSPYLLQHAHNPVEWYPWGEEALNKAKEEDKMLIVSIGYSSCHWCHVMEHESFEDTAVARIMNENFVCIKVDREERPDIDDIYMTACQIATGRGGWPLNAFAMSDGRPVWAGTYFPKEQWIRVLQNFIDTKKNDPNKLEKSASALTNEVRQSDQIIKIEEEQEFQQSVLDSIDRKFLANFDMKFGGRYGAPKFPMPNNWDFLLAYGTKYNNNTSIESVLLTLDRMSQGGIFDPLGGGFARYSTDAEWKVPHFEKMLYDNGQLVSLYANAYRLTNNPEYLHVLTKTLDWIKREMTDSSGGFYSSLDADSEGEEGKYYVWSYEELKEVITNPDDFDLYSSYYSVKEHGNWEEGKNILYRSVSDSLFASRNNMELEDLWNKIDTLNSIVYKRQIERIRPGLDDKVLTSWNALMLKGLTDAFKATGKEEYKKLALDNAGFLTETQMDKNGLLHRNFKDGKSSINAFLDDYALLADALVSLYEITFDEKWLQFASKLADYTMTHFSNTENSMFNYTSDLDPPLVARKLELSDNVIPSSNSIMARMLYRLGDLLYNKEYLDRSRQMLKNMYPTLVETSHPNYYSNWCHLLFEWINPTYEIAIVGPDAVKLRDEMMKNYLPNAVFLGGETEGSLELLEEKLQDGETFIYVCQNKICKFPVQDVASAMKLID